MMDGKDSVFDFNPKRTPTQNRRRLPAFVDEFNKSFVVLVTGVKLVFFTVGYSTLRCKQLVLV
jgi:hypothetical protein